MCPFCQRRVRKRKDNPDLRLLHYVNVSHVFSFKLKKCQGCDPNGCNPGWSTIQDGKKSGIRCQACGKRVKETKTFLPVKHTDQRGAVCPGWRDNQR